MNFILEILFAGLVFGILYVVLVVALAPFCIAYRVVKRATSDGHVTAFGAGLEMADDVATKCCSRLSHMV